MFFRILQSEIYELLDAIVVEDELTSSKTWNVALNDVDFYLEFTVRPTASTGAVASIKINETSSTYLNIGDLYGNANCGIQWTGGSSFYGKTISVDEDTKVTVTRRGTNVVLTVGESTYNISDMPITCNTLYSSTITNNSITDMKIYPI